VTKHLAGARNKGAGGGGPKKDLQEEIR
jgi:hypothetical protein